MAEVRVGKNESLDRALKRFQELRRREGIMAELRKREHYDKPSERRKKKAQAARRKKR
ncbi:MAG: 30S ribosomal protein S21 [Limnochordales bacterium]|nr:30S ribosomal protein S21 [Bacillota bacterium]